MPESGRLCLQSGLVEVIMSNQQYSLESGDDADLQIKGSTPTMRYNVIWMGFLVGLGFYVTDIIVDVFIFRSGTLNRVILNPTFHEIWMRTAVIIVAVAFAIYVQILLRREHKTSERALIAERFLGSVVDNIPNMVFIKDAKELRLFSRMIDAYKT